MPEKKRKYRPSDFEAVINRHHPDLPYYITQIALPLLDMNPHAEFSAFEQKIKPHYGAYYGYSPHVVRAGWDACLKAVECAERLNQEIV